MSCFKKMAIGLVLANNIGASSNQMHDVKQLETKKSIKQKGLKNGKGRKVPKLSFEKDKPKKSDALRSQLEEANDELVKDKEQSARNLLKVPGRARHSDTRCEKEKFKDQLKALKAQISALRGKKTCWQMSVNKIGNPEILSGLDISYLNGIWYQYQGLHWTWFKDDCIKGKGCVVNADNGEFDIFAHADREWVQEEIAECEFGEFGIRNIEHAIKHCFDGSTQWQRNTDQKKVMTVSFEKVACHNA